MAGLGLFRAAGIVAVLGLAGCQGFDVSRLDLDLRNNAPGGLDTSNAARAAVADRPEPDANGLITYPTYQVAVARRGDTLASMASRIGADAEALARFNGISTDTKLNAGAVIALPSRVTPPTSGGQTDIAAVAGAAIDRASTATPAAPLEVQEGEEPVRHKVARGETAFSIARLYGVTPNSLAEWNGLGSDLAVREGQFLIIPLVIGENGAEVVAEPGAGSTAPPPPSASTALPDSVEAQALPPSPNLNDSRTAASAGVATIPASAPGAVGGLALVAPVEGSVKTPFSRQNEGVDYAARLGAPVRAAAEGSVAAITRDTDQVPILILRHPDGYLTVYANIKDIRVDKGDSVRAGQRIASVGGAEPAFLHFELRKGLDALDPMPFIK